MDEHAGPHGVALPLTHQPDGAAPGGLPPAPRSTVVPLVDTDPTTVSDAHLAQAWAARDPFAPREVYRRFAVTLFGVAACLLDDRAAATDVVHEALVRADRRVGGLRSPSRLRIWLLALVRCESVRYEKDRYESDRHEAVRYDSSRYEAVRCDSARPAVPPATWRPIGGSGPFPGLADDLTGPGAHAECAAEELWSAAAALDGRDREVLEFWTRGVTDSDDLGDVLGVEPVVAMTIAADLRVRLDTSLAALRVARRGRDDCRVLAALLEPHAPVWTEEVCALVAGHLESCVCCRATRARFGVPAAPAGPRRVVLATDLRDRLVASLGADRPAVVPGEPDRGGRGWRPDGFPVQAPVPVLRIADRVPERTAAGARPSPVQTAGADTGAVAARRLQRVPVSAFVLLGVPLVLGGIALSGGLGALGSPRASPTMPAPGQTRGAGPITAPTGPATRVSDRPAEVAGSVPASSAALPGRPVGGRTPAARTRGTVAVTASRAGSTSRGSPSPSSSPSDTRPTLSPTPTAAAPAKPVVTGVAVTPTQIKVPGGQGCKPRRSVVVVFLADATGARGTLAWSPNGKKTKSVPMSADGSALTGVVGPVRVVGTTTITITVTNPAGAVTTTRTLQVADCGGE